MSLSHHQILALADLVKEHDAQEVSTWELPHRTAGIALFHDDDQTPVLRATISVGGTIREAVTA